MSLTLLGLSIAPLYLFLVVNPKQAHKGLKDLTASPGLRMVFTWVYLLLALIILSSTGLSSFNFDSWSALLPWLGLLIAVKGTLILLFPSLFESSLKKFKANQFPIFGFIGLLFVLFLVYVDTQLI